MNPTPQEQELLAYGGNDEIEEDQDLFITKLHAQLGYLARTRQEWDDAVERYANYLTETQGFPAEAKGRLDVASQRLEKLITEHSNEWEQGAAEAGYDRDASLAIDEGSEQLRSLDEYRLEAKEHFHRRRDTIFGAGKRA